MVDFTVVIFLMVVIIGLSVLTEKLKLSYPIVLVIAGIVIGFIPALPNLTLDPKIVFVIFLPPLLYDAATKTSWNDFKTAIVPISSLAIILVFFTTTAVAIAATISYQGSRGL